MHSSLCIKKQTLTALRKFSLTPSEKLTLTLHRNSDWLCKQLKCEISQRLSRKPFDTLKKIRRDYTCLGGLNKTVNFAFQTTGVDGVGAIFFFFLKEAWGKPWRRRSSTSFQPRLRPWIFPTQLFPAPCSYKTNVHSCWLHSPFQIDNFSTYTMANLAVNT